MSDRNSNPYIVWAFDVFEDVERQLPLAKTLESWAGGGKCRIEPVYVMSPIYSPPDRDLSTVPVERVREGTLSRMRECLSSLKLPGLLEPALICCHSVSRRAAAKALLDHAAHRGADLIATFTRSSSGVGHLMMGSFAETLILGAEIPVLAMNPQAKPMGKLEHILFPTDLGPDTRRILESWILPLAQRHAARVTLLHCRDFLYEHPEAGFGPPESTIELQQIDLKRQKHSLEALVQEARHASGLSIDSLFMEDEPRPGAAILSTAERVGASLIALISRKEGLDVRLLGSVSREILRASPVPTLIRHVEEKG